MLIFGTTPAPMGPSDTVSNAVNTYQYLGAKILGSFSFPNFYSEFKDNKLISQDLNDKLKTEIDKLIKELNWINYQI